MEHIYMHNAHYIEGERVFIETQCDHVTQCLAWLISHMYLNYFYCCRCTSFLPSVRYLIGADGMFHFNPFHQSSHKDVWKLHRPSKSIVLSIFSGLIL